MPFVPYGKKAKQQRAGQAKREADDRVIDRVVERAQFAVRHAAGQSLPLCMLVERVLAQALAGRGFTVRLGALEVAARRGLADPIAFDPRGGGTPPVPGPLAPDVAFHAWLETPRGLLLDPSIFLRLHAAEYHVERGDYVLGEGREHARGDLGFRYDELPGLEVVGVAESAAYLERAVSFVEKGFPLDLGASALAAAWRAAG